MPEQLDEKQKLIDEYQFITPKDKLGYAEEYITFHEDNKLLNYSLSNSIDDIKIAIFTRTGLNIDLDKAKWIINHDLSISVKHLMNKHKVSFSMTIYNDGKVRVIVINMRNGDNWFSTRYGELNGKCYSWDHFEIVEKLRRLIDKYSIDPEMFD
ncbi:MAG: hypothetical protein FWC21_04555 [Treponema sp.]|nr:hypothetical protein [Treponema sp.]